MWRRRPQPTSLLLLALLPSIGLAQETRGQATIALQGYYLGDSTSAPASTNGAAVTFQYYFDKAGQLRGRVEDYVDASRFQTAENFLSWNGLPWRGLRWNLTAGDFRIALQPRESQFGNIFYPEFRVRGIQVEAIAGSVTWSAFSGSLQMMQGSRLPFSLRTPQTLTGGSATWKHEERLEVQSSLVYISTDAAKLAERPYVLPEGRAFAGSLQGRVNTLWRPAKGLKVQAEVGLNSARAFTPQPSATTPWSMTTSAEWVTSRFTFRGSYVRQGAAYMPLAGYFLGDRKGPFAEIRYRPHRRIDLYAAGTLTESNVDRKPALWTMRSQSGSAGFTLDLPLHFSLNAQASSLSFRSRRDAEARAGQSLNRQTSLSLSRAFARHNIRFSYRELNLRSTISPLLQRSGELSEMVAFRRWTASGAVRFDSSASDIHRNGIYFRGNLQANFHHFSAFGYTEIGHDLANQSVFITNQLRSSGAGVSAPLGRHWSLSAEMMRNSLNSTLNQQNAFLLASNGSPVFMTFPGMDRWNVLFRVSRSFHWGGAGPVNTSGHTVNELYPVMGALEGFVRESVTGDGPPVAGVPVQLDGNRTEHTDQFGRFRFADVTQGSHTLQLPPRQLPTEFDPASAGELPVVVQARRTTRADLSLVRLGSLSGKIVAPKGTPLEDIIVRLAGTRRYTSPDADGNFTIYNLPQGHYVVTIDPETLPAEHRVTTAPSVPVTLKQGQPHEVILFGLAKVEAVKPVRRIILSSLPRLTDSPAFSALHIQDRTSPGDVGKPVCYQPSSPIQRRFTPGIHPTSHRPVRHVHRRKPQHRIRPLPRNPLH